MPARVLNNVQGFAVLGGIVTGVLGFVNFCGGATPRAAIVGLVVIALAGMMALVREMN